MKRNVWKRYYENNRGEIFIQRAYVPWWVYINPFLWPFAHKLRFKEWEDEELLDNKKYKLEEKMNKLANEARKTKAELDEVTRQLEVERREIKNSHSTRRGFSEPWLEKADFFPKEPVFLNPPSGAWRAAFSHQLLNSGDKKKAHVANTKERAGMAQTSDGKFVGPPTKAIVLDQHKNIHFDGDFDSVESVDGNKNQGGKGQNKGSWKNRRKGESDEEYNERLRNGKDS